jgi:ABC-type antimicrobial peptide transport system permease subunit
MFQDVTVQARSLNLAVAMPWTVIATALVVSLGIGVIGSVWPGFRASRMKMVDAIGSVE